MKLGIVGLPNVGKSTLFNAITQAGAESANYPFCTIEPNIGVVAVPDHRLHTLQNIYQSEKVIPAAVEFYDIAGLVRGASKGEGLGNQFLSHIREVSAILHVVRCFKDENITHVDGDVNPIRDIETINLELMLADLEVVEKRIEKTQKLLKGNKNLADELHLFNEVKNILQKGTSIRSLSFPEEEAKIVRSLNLLSSKPVIYVANVAEEDILNNGSSNPYIQQLHSFAEKEKAQVIMICAKIEEEIAELPEEEKDLFLKDLGLQESGLNRLIRASYSLLGLISFLTAGPKEVKAWTIKKGTKAPQAAGKIHSDMERGFIRAEIIAFDDLVQCGTYAAAREKGLVRLEGKEYVIQDGDVILFRFNV